VIVCIVDIIGHWIIGCNCAVASLCVCLCLCVFVRLSDTTSTRREALILASFVWKVNSSCLTMSRGLSVSCDRDTFIYYQRDLSDENRHYYRIDYWANLRPSVCCLMYSLSHTNIRWLACVAKTIRLSKFVWLLISKFIPWEYDTCWKKTINCSRDVFYYMVPYYPV